ncbi:MAG: penicillin-binding protein 2 [Candidatus Levybacteria bacterium]|nr:penicillin-binding protein 2 [Candidatus Levybacteria bacterium]
MIWRFRLVLFLLLFSLFVVIIRLFYWQVVKAQELYLLGQSQYGKDIKIVPQRGDIMTSDGFPIVTNKISYLLFANPKEVKDTSATIQTLKQILDIDEASASAQLKRDRFWVPLKKDLTAEEKKNIEKLSLSGIGFEKQYKRFYPEASMSAHLVGFVGKDENGDDKGYFGLEGFYDRLLKGKEGRAVQIHDAVGRPILAEASSDTKAINGSGLKLNIDRSVQFMLEEKLKEGLDRYGASRVSAAILEPVSGNVIAMATFPSFDPQSYQEYSEDLFKDPFISSLYEPGSTFKPLVMSAAIDKELVKPETKCPICVGPYSIGGYEIHTWNDKYYKDINMIGVIQHSDNVGMVYVAEKLGVDRMVDYLEKFGIGDLTGIDLQGETAHPLPPKNIWYPVDLATKGFGQGITLTPMELLNAFSTIANDGIRMEPHVVSEIVTPEGKKIKIEPKELGRPISETTAKVMTEILVNAVKKGEASWAAPKGYRIAGKTGTASIPIKGHYDPNQTIASFIGFAPADNPRFSMLVIVDRPTTSIYGAETAAPIFFRIARNLLSYYGIPPAE